MAVVKADILGAESGASDAAGRSTQVPEDAWDYAHGLAKEPPYNLDALAQFLEINTYHMRCCKTKAIVTAGLGYDLVASEGVESPSPENKAVLQRFFSYPNEEMTWGEILENVLTDFEALGNGYFEVVRNRFGLGPPRAIYHVPAVTMRVRRDRTSADTYLALQDGWRKIAKTSGHLYEHGGGGVSTTVLAELLDRLPEKFLRDYQDLRFYVSPNFEHGYKRLLGQRPTPVGDKFLMAEARAAYSGIPLVRVPIIPSNLSEDIGGTVRERLTFVRLTPRKNLITGIHRKMTLERDKNIFARMRRYAFTSRVAVAVEETDAMAIAEQVSVGS